MSYDQDTIIEKNITLSFEFTRYLHEHPALLAQIPQDTEVILLPKDDPELYHVNLETARQAQETGARNLVYVEIEALAPPRSRLVNPHLTKRPVLATAPV